MKIAMYELLGMVKDGKAPKRIRFLNHYYIWKENDEDYQKEDGLMLFGNIKINYILNSEVEILEEEKKIPDKLGYCKENTFMEQKETTYLSSKERTLLDSNFKELGNKINEIIDCLDYLKSKGDE